MMAHESENPMNQLIKGVYAQSDAFHVCSNCGHARSRHRFTLGQLRCNDSAVTLPKGARRPGGVDAAEFEEAMKKRLPDGWTVKKAACSVNPWLIFNERGENERFAGYSKTMAIFFALCTKGMLQPQYVDERVRTVVDDLSRESAIDLLDEALGVSCYDERDDYAVRAEVISAYQLGKISGAAILAHVGETVLLD
jgi:ribosomal protein L37AE/L43A